MFGPTIQGEGSVIGQQTYFLRFGGCDYRCTQCDSLHAVTPSLIKAKAERLTQPEIADRLETFHRPFTTRWVTFSGGNPCIYDLGLLCSKLHLRKWKIAVETQGTIYQDWLWNCDVVTVSPKTPGMGERYEPEKFKAFLEPLRFHRYLGSHVGLCVKVVIFSRDDLDIAKRIFDDSNLHVSQLYLSQGNPFATANLFADTLSDLLRGRYFELFDAIKADPLLSQVKFLPQWHVWLWGNKQGV